MQRIKDQIEVTGLTPRQISLKATGNPDSIRNILARRSMPSADRLAAIARELHVTSAYLLGETDFRNDVHEKLASEHAKKLAETSPAQSPNIIDTPLPRRNDMVADIPVYGTALGAELSVKTLTSGELEIEQTDLNSGEVIDYFRRPPGISNMRKIYGLYTAGTSMEPVFDSGSPLIVDPTRPPQIRDYVVVYLRDRQNDADGVAASVLIKRLARRSASFVELEQFNPPAIFRLAQESIASIHRVMTLSEIIGV